MKRFLLALILVAATLAPGLRPLTAVALAQTTGPGGAPQIQPNAETLRYTQAASPTVETYVSTVLAGADQFPNDPSPEQVKDTDLRKQILALRLMLDFNAFAYDPHAFKTYRDAADTAYEAMGTYQDLYVTSQIDGAPIDAGQQAALQTTMQKALAPFRDASFRDGLKSAFAQASPQPVELEAKDRPLLWQMAGSTPSNDLDSVGNAALLGQGILHSLSDQGLLVDNILDPPQEERFHAVRKALRSVVDLDDLYPSLATATHDVQKPLDNLVDAYGDVNDQSVAYHAAQASGQDVDARAAALRDTYAKAQSVASKLVDGGELAAYVAQLSDVQAAHQLSPNVVQAQLSQGGGTSVGDLQFAAQVSKSSTPVDPQIEFSRDNHGVWVTFDYANLPVGSQLTRIVRFNGDDFNWDSDQYGHLDCCQAGGSGQYAFRVERLDGDNGSLPGGAYDVRIYLDGTEVAHGGFGINSAHGSGDEIPGGDNHPNHGGS